MGNCLYFEGSSDMHCMSGQYLAEDLTVEFQVHTLNTD